MLGSHIAYVAAVTKDVERATTVLGSALRLPRLDLSTTAAARPPPAFGIGASALVLFAPGDPLVGRSQRTGIHHIAIGVPDLGSAERHADTAGIGLAPAPGLDGREGLELSVADTRGVTVRLVTPLALPAPGAGCFVERFDHIGIATDDSATTEACFVGKLGFAVESRQTDTELQIALESFSSDRYGSMHHARAPRQVGGGNVVFITIGDTELELLQPLNAPEERGAPGQAGDTRQDMGALGRFLAGRGPGLHHVALKVPDTDEALARVREAGGRTIDELGRPGSRRARIGFVHPSAFGGILVHFGERDDPDRGAGGA